MLNLELVKSQVWKHTINNNREREREEVKHQRLETSAAPVLISRIISGLASFP